MAWTPADVLVVISGTRPLVGFCLHTQAWGCLSFSMQPSSAHQHNTWTIQWVSSGLSRDCCWHLGKFRRSSPLCNCLNVTIMIYKDQPRSACAHVPAKSTRNCPVSDIQKGAGHMLKAGFYGNRPAAFTLFLSAAWIRFARLVLITRASAC